MGRVITPSDWAFVGRSFQVVIQAEPDDPELELRVVSLQQYKARGVNSEPIHRIACEPGPDGVLQRCMVPELPALGNYILMLGRAKAFGPYTTFSGVIVSDRRAWSMTRPRLPKVREREAPLFSVLTTVYDTDPRMLEETVASVLGQQFRDFEWLVLDNGSRVEKTVAAVAALEGRDPRIRTFRVEDNIHIVRGNRYVLDRARGEYILPIDADDLLYPEALEWLARGINAHSGIAMIYADEEKIDAFSQPISPLYRETWSRISSIGTTPCAHPTAFRRDIALQCNIYTDERTRGSHDWDTALRFADRHQRALHVPAILYGWRVHMTSTSLDGRAKAYVESSQRDVVTGSLVRRGIDHLFEVRAADFGLGYFQLVRRPLEPAPMQLLLLLRSADPAHLQNAVETVRITDYPLAALFVAGPPEAMTTAALEQLAAAAAAKGHPVPTFRTLDSMFSLEPLRDEAGLNAATGHIAIVDSALRLARGDWLWDALGGLQLDPEVGIVGGYVYDHDENVLHMGIVACLADGNLTPLYGEPSHKILRSFLMRHRAVTAVHAGFIVVRDSLVREIGLPAHADWDAVSCDPAWTRAALEYARTSDMAPHMIATRVAFRTQGSIELPRLEGRYPAVPGVDPYYAWYLSRMSDTWGEVAFDEDF